MDYSAAHRHVTPDWYEVTLLCLVCTLAPSLPHSNGHITGPEISPETQWLLPLRNIGSHSHQRVHMATTVVESIGMAALVWLIIQVPHRHCGPLHECAGCMDAAAEAGHSPPMAPCVTGSGVTFEIMAMRAVPVIGIVNRIYWPHRRKLGSLDVSLAALHERVLQQKPPAHHP